MKRKIIKIDEEKCNGCGVCIPNCPEGALQVIDGKARLISDIFCDGLGACIGECPLGAIEVEEREAEPYDEKLVMQTIVKGGENLIKAHLKHLDDHNEEEFLRLAKEYLTENNIDIPDYKEAPKMACGCPSSMTRDLRETRTKGDEILSGACAEQSECAQNNASANMASKLNNWPVQLQLLSPNASYLKGADLVIAADCTAFAYPNFHQKFLKDKILIMFCPKLDVTLEQYVEKLSAIFEMQDIQSITLIRMEVPCCSGVEQIIKQALIKSNKNIIIKEYIVSINGELI